MTMRVRSDVEVELIHRVGGDETVIASARVSTQAEKSRESLERSPRESDGLIQFLMKNRHGSPFEHNQFCFYIEAPIFVFREFHRHRVGWSYNETSGRYRELEPVFYVPDYDRPLSQVGKPGHYTFEKAPADLVTETRERLASTYFIAFQQYQDLLSRGVAKEIARCCLPVGTYSSMYATCNARSLMHFLSLRTESDNAAYPSSPQKEIAMVADQMEAIFREEMPLTWNAWNVNWRVAP